MAEDGGQPGTVVELSPHDALGWIELDSGGRVRFGGTALRGRVVEVGARVAVVGTTTGYGGVVKAVEVVPLDRAPDEREVAEERPEMAWPDFVARYPRLGDPEAVAAPCLVRVPRLELSPHPLFAPWAAEIAETMPTRVGLRVPEWNALDPIDPGRSDSFAHGSAAFLDRAWPACGHCSRGLEMCIQLAPEVVAPFVPGRGALVAMFCFHCGVSRRDDPAVGFVGFVDPTTRVTHPDADWKTASSGWQPRSQRVTPLAPARVPPSSSWYSFRAERDPTLAAGPLLHDTVRFVGPFPPGLDPEEMLDDPGAELDDWLARHAKGAGWGGAALGGVPEWDQADETPKCHGEMRQLLEHEGGQFLDGALHVFLCRDPACAALRFVAEF
jgi:hypothetical protein